MYCPNAARITEKAASTATVVAPRWQSPKRSPARSVGTPTRLDWRIAEIAVRGCPPRPRHVQSRHRRNPLRSKTIPLRQSLRSHRNRQRHLSDSRNNRRPERRPCDRAIAGSRICRIGCHSCAMWHPLRRNRLQFRRAQRMTCRIGSRSCVPSNRKSRRPVQHLPPTRPGRPQMRSSRSGFQSGYSQSPRHKTRRQNDRRGYCKVSVPTTSRNMPRSSLPSRHTQRQGGANGSVRATRLAARFRSIGVGSAGIERPGYRWCAAGLVDFRVSRAAGQRRRAAGLAADVIANRKLRGKAGGGER